MICRSEPSMSIGRRTAAVCHVTGLTPARHCACFCHARCSAASLAPHRSPTLYAHFSTSASTSCCLSLRGTVCGCFSSLVYSSIWADGPTQRWDQVREAGVWGIAQHAFADSVEPLPHK